MTDVPYIIRNYRPSDFRKYCQLYREADRTAGYRSSSRSLAESLHRPGYSPEHDLFIVETAGSIVACLDITAEIRIKRAVFYCLVHPAHCRQGLASQLLSYALRRASEMGIKVAQSYITQDNTDAEAALSRLGFEFARRFLRMTLDIKELLDKEANNAEQQGCHLQHGDEDKLAEIQNRAFTGSWGYNSNTVEDINYRLSLEHCSPHDVLLANDGDMITGYCWTRKTGKDKGQIYMLGVNPDYRGRGTGKKLLLAGLSYLKSKGATVAELEVDCQNETAYALYQAMGFKVKDNILWYEKAVG